MLNPVPLLAKSLPYNLKISESAVNFYSFDAYGKVSGTSYLLYSMLLENFYHYVVAGVDKIM